jgi:carbon-monoxide dehydrogenase medium subunit/xanthine dehydrogenase FAD-binding subunit
MPRAVVDISRISELRGIHDLADSISIRPLVTHAQIVRSPLLKSLAPILSVAASTIGSPQIRNRGTVGGNIMNAAACADMVPPLVALDAEVVVQSARGRRSCKLSEFFVQPYETKSEHDEILIDIRFRKPAPSVRGAFVKLGRRNALAISRLSVAAMLRLDEDSRILDARIVPGAAFPTWMRVGEAEQLLLNQEPSEELFSEVGRKVSEVMIGFTGRRWSTEYKEPVLAVLVRRALQSCVCNHGHEHMHG